MLASTVSVFDWLVESERCSGFGVLAGQDVQVCCNPGLIARLEVSCSARD